MKAITLVLLLVLLFPAAALAGNIFGDLKEGGRSVGQGVEVKISCGDAAEYSTNTDAYGAYSVRVPNGRCALSVWYKNTWTPPFSIASSDDPARYDFDLVYENGRYVLKRR